MKKIIFRFDKLLVSLLLTMYVFIVPVISFAAPTADTIRIVEVEADAPMMGGLIVADPKTPLRNASAQNCTDHNWCPAGGGYCTGAHIPIDTQVGLSLYDTALSVFEADLSGLFDTKYIIVTDGCYAGLPKVIRIGVQLQWALR